MQWGYQTFYEAERRFHDLNNYLNVVVTDIL